MPFMWGVHRATFLLGLPGRIWQHTAMLREDMTWLASESGKQQFLTWLVRGAIRWYKDGRTLGALPAKLQTALDDYLGGPHTDALLSQFIQECCIQEIEAKQSKPSMYAAFVAFAGSRASVQYDEFNSTMKRLHSQFVPDKRTRLHREQGQKSAFVGIRLACNAEAGANST
ncbi:hypothetical protein WJX73_009916 [Symbiochloris irregularis]|uniref:Uncharacterized protein n=1 Tax=Symbiochloris irregularis TaxID=706552 RepID=A0AAW1P9N9_9CHLO